jgi:ABC-type antimicrobial peptide transport system permease subunit
MTPEALKEQNISLVEGGRLPKTDGSELELVFGNLATENLMEKGTDKGYWETGVMPDVDVMKAQMFLVLDSDAYYNTLHNTGGTAISTENSSSASTGGTTPTKAPKKYVVHASGRVTGDENTYNAHSYNVYCDITTLKNMLKKEYAGRAIPGQPTTKSGKPYKFFAYTNAMVQVDDIDNVDAVASEIQNLGYKVTTNAEYVKSMQKQFAMIQAVLGGIGAVSLFVAAIGIMNTMMMSIYERTKEIGVIKVLGCSLKNIKQMFLLEAAFIGFIGGVVGNLLSFLMSFIINILTRNGSAMGLDGNISYIPPWLVIASMTFAILIGMVAGYFPALRAMKLSPLAAIRNE